MATSQKDIAEELNVSIATVSRSLRGHPDIRPKTRRKVIELASRLGYRPWETLRRYKHQNAASEKLMMAGVLVYRREDPSDCPSTAAYHILAGISPAAAKMNVSLVTHFVSPKDCHRIADLQHQFPAMRTGILSGLVLIYDFPDETVQDLACSLPCVTIVHPHLDLGADCVDSDHAEGIGMVTAHLYRLGHRKIGFMSNVTGGSWLFPRFAGYMRALKRLGLTCDPSLAINVYNSNLDEEAQAEAVMEHYRRGATAWVCAGDAIGYDLYTRLTARGLRIPRDISITGFDGLTPPRGCPQLATVHQPFERMGTAAVRRLLNRIKHPDEPVCHLQFGCEFIEGETTAPPSERRSN